MYITSGEIIPLLNTTKGKFFRVVFIKRTTGEVRTMIARMGVRKHLKGGSPAYDFKEKGLIPVYDVQKRGYRSIPIEGIKSLRVNGVDYTVTSD